MSLHDYHVVCSIDTSEHSVNIRTNSVFGKIRPSYNCRFRTYVILHCLNEIRIFYNFLVKTCFHHNICHHKIQKKFFKISFLWILIPAKMIVACSLERWWIAEGTRHRPERLAWNNVDSHWPVCVDWAGDAFVSAQSLRSCQMNKCHFTIIMSCVQSTLRNFGNFGTFGKYSDKIFGQIRLSEKLNNCHFTSLHDYHVVYSIHTSEHSVNFWTNSVFEKIRPADNCRFRTYVILHCLNQIRIFL